MKHLLPGVLSLLMAVAASPAGLPAAPRGAEIRYLALGDSFTIGTGSSPAQAFPARLVEIWRSSGRAVTLKNVAVNGFTTQNLLDREMVEVAPFAPTLVTLAMFPILVLMYGRLAKTEERDMLVQFGDEYRRYMAAVPGFFPKLGSAGKEPGAMRRP